MVSPCFRRNLTALLLVLLTVHTAPALFAQNVTAELADEAASGSKSVAVAALNELRDENVEKALELLGTKGVATSVEKSTAAAVGGLYRALNQLDTDEQYELLHAWTMPTAERKELRVLTSVVPELRPPSEFARALGQRPRKDSFAVASVGSMPGIFCSAWTMIVAADDAGSLRQLISELEKQSADDVVNANFVLTLARLRDSRSEIETLVRLLTPRIEGSEGVPLPADRSDAVLVAAAAEREGLGKTAEQIAERLNTFDFSDGTTSFVPFLRRLRAHAILRSRSPETEPRDLFYLTPDLWVSANDQRAGGRTTGADEAVWLTHEDHVKRLAGPGDDLLLLRYPLAGTFELKGEIAELEHGGGGLTFGGVAFDANAKAFTLMEAQRGHSVDRVWPFVAPKEHRMFNRVNLRSDGTKVVYLSNLHPGFTSSVETCSSSPWLGLRAFGDGRIIFRNLELVGEPTIPREVRLVNAADLRGWTSSYAEASPKFVKPFPTRTDDTVFPDPIWQSVDGAIQCTAAADAEPDQVAQSHLAYIRPCLEEETISYEFFYEEGKTTAHPTLGRLAFLIEPRGVRLHWLTRNETEWTGLETDNAVIEPLNRRGSGKLALKSGDWNTVSVELSRGKVSLSLNDEEIYERPLDDLSGRHFGIYHDRNQSSVQVRNVVLTGDWPEKLTADQLGNLVAFGSE